MVGKEGLLNSDERKAHSLRESHNYSCSSLVVLVHDRWLFAHLAERRCQSTASGESKLSSVDSEPKSRYKPSNG